jgi:hypothetical protein
LPLLFFSRASELGVVVACGSRVTSGDVTGAGAGAAAAAAGAVVVAAPAVVVVDVDVAAVVVVDVDVLFAGAAVVVCRAAAPVSSMRVTDADFIDSRRSSSVVVAGVSSIESTDVCEALAIFIAWSFGYTNSLPIVSPG